MALKAPLHRHQARPKFEEECTGFSPRTWLHVTPQDESLERPLRPAWITDVLLAETIEVWTEAYGRPVSVSEAIDILSNVGWLAEALLKAKQEVQQ